MYTVPQINQVEITDSSSQSVPCTGLVSDKKMAGGYSFHCFPRETVPPRKTLPELLACIGKNFKLVDELASRKSREQRISILINEKLITSEGDLPAGKEVKQDMKYLFAFDKKRNERLEGAYSACSFIAFGGSYDD